MQPNSSFSRLDWDFANSHGRSSIHSIHSYPAKFIPHIPRQAIEVLYPGNSTVILDPFVGSGTTLVEATSAGIDSFGIDVHPLACLISKVKTTQVRQRFQDRILEVVMGARARIAHGDIAIPAIPRLDHWFEMPAQLALAALISEIRLVDNQDIEDALCVALSSIIVQVSNQESDTRYAAKTNTIETEDVILRFEKVASKLRDTLTNYFDNTNNQLGNAKVINSDILAVSPIDLPRNVGLVVTSPPYPNAYEYWLYHKYRMYWLGMDPLAVKNQEIGARAHYFKKNHPDERDFERQMGTCFELLSKVMIEHGKACFVVGRSIIHGRLIDNVQLLIRASKPFGFTIEDIAGRKIPRTRKTFNPLHGSIDEEHVVVLSLGEPK